MRLLVTAFLLSFVPHVAQADEVLLTFQHDDATFEFDLAGLEALGNTEIVTTTIWTEGKQTFNGVQLVDFLKEFDVTTGNLVATAINDYEIVIPIRDAVEGGPIIAYFQNGKPMSVRNKGPLWIIYPYDSDIGYQSEVVYSRSIWQLDRLKLE